MQNQINYVEGKVLYIKSLFFDNLDSERAIKMEKYMKNKFLFYGIMAPKRKELLKEVVFSMQDKNNYIPLAKALFKEPNRELHYIAMELLLRAKKQWKQPDLATLKQFITTNSWWDTVDFLASNVIGLYFKMYPDEIYPEIIRMNRSTDMWLRRTSIIFQLKYKHLVNQELLSACILSTNHEEEFFIKKAIGWSLREYAKYNPDWVLNFVKTNTLKPLSNREALKHF